MPRFCLSPNDNPFFVRQGFAAGGRGFVTKSDAGADLRTAIRMVHLKRSFVSRSIKEVSLGSGVEQQHPTKGGGKFGLNRLTHFAGCVGYPTLLTVSVLYSRLGASVPRLANSYRTPPWAPVNCSDRTRSQSCRGMLVRYSSR
jgi:hypothetical protein